MHRSLLEDKSSNGSRNTGDWWLAINDLIMEMLEKRSKCVLSLSSTEADKRALCLVVFPFWEEDIQILRFRAQMNAWSGLVAGVAAYISVIIDARFEISAGCGKEKERTPGTSLSLNAVPHTSHYGCAILFVLDSITSISPKSMCSNGLLSSVFVITSISNMPVITYECVIN